MKICAYLVELNLFQTAISLLLIFHIKYFNKFQCDHSLILHSFSFKNINEVPISNMGVYFLNQVIRSTNALGEFSVKNLSACKTYEFVLATEVANPLAGLSTKDILLIQ